ncbi:MAG: hypothetical protein FJ022_02370 [Chloroflexi bacterium]|nr:hypothetical protein [Chloroflexota bacterium]MBM3172677.1 hypothetical protein [Chloroflexota bacterium]MBM4449644.1 hypothetical protein [Chloroflexota bacterium]
MMQQVYNLLASFFVRPSLLGIGLAIAFSAIWLVFYKPPLFKKPWMWAVLAGGAILTPVAIVLVQLVATPVVGGLFRKIWSAQTLKDWFPLVVIPRLFILGLVREGVKLVPVIVYWLCKGRKILPKFGLSLGAVAGAGLGFLEAQWVLKYIFADGWSWADVQKYGAVIALSGFWETFFILGYNIAACALAGWGLSKGWGWQFYLLAALAYVVLMYSPLLAQVELVGVVQMELIIASWACLLTGIVLWLGRRGGPGKDDD